MKKILASLLAAFALVTGAQAAGGALVLDKFPKERVSDLAALQNGAKLFVNYCLNCHSAAFMRFNRLTDIGLTEQQIKDNLLFPTDKVGEVMKVSLDAKDAKAWFGALPPDLTLVARSRASGSGSGADYLYTYLRTFYRDDTRPTGWNNLTFPNVGMPHALWELQGQRAAKFVDVVDPHDPTKKTHEFEGFEQLTPGTMSPQEYDSAIADLVAYMQWMGEPAQQQRTRIGVGVLIFLAIFFVIAWRLNAAFWKDVK
ncbi:cytochrome c1 [Aquabacterium sp.]|jgi:ubiquinol-cytochrome c reductase cytochrome c1 subunit|uniref:cytochrome c1 n=1 Tax=Aquabacterium sp. TaxID=1872578 RepID=UPI001B584708|nr:cytochrome c1 [Aquabacterium sp.]MBP6612071.1 cytochrome c1 [Aquabacterium sp.]MBP6614546.1 cytochrome c1 [Aquabacterium sp.]MBP7501853.1 cytochrome c1 [Aquabacterium sp.]MCC6219016.1 cytochrome c1 [Aquabacterium sp.]MDD2975720.1 cytochrome c1 [Aquabacterium sp.]